jgi:hypothetical protein
MAVVGLKGTCMLLLLRGGREICQYIAVNSWHLTKTLFCSGSREAQKEVQDTVEGVMIHHVALTRERGGGEG